MRRRLFIGTATALAGTAAAAVAGGAGARAQRQPPDAEAAREANSAVYAALSARDPRAFEALLAEEPSPGLVLPVSRAPAIGREAVRRDYEALFARYPEFSIMVAEPEVRVASGSAVVTGAEAVRARTANGEAAAFALIGTNVFLRGGDGRWLLVHRHVSLAPGS